MQISRRASAVGVAVLAFGMIGGPAFAQSADEVEGFLPGECQAAVRQVLAGKEDGRGTQEQRDYIEELLDGGASANRICTFYIPSVIPPDEEEPETEVLDEVDSEVDEVEDGGSAPGGSGDAPGRDTDAAEVLGRTLSRTGADATLLALMGASLLGLGVVAVRRTRRSDPA